MLYFVIKPRLSSSSSLFAYLLMRIERMDVFV